MPTGRHLDGSSPALPRSSRAPAASTSCAHSRAPATRRTQVDRPLANPGRALLRTVLLTLAAGAAVAANTRAAEPRTPASSQSAGGVTLESLVDALEAALGDPAPLGDIELAGVMHGPDGTFERRILIRRRPFAYREELALRTELGPPAAKDRAAASTPARQFFVSDGQSAWALYDEFGPGGLLSGSAAVELLDRALFLRLLLDPRATFERGLEGTARIATEQVSASVAASGVRGPGLGLPQNEEALFVSSRHGTAWMVYLDRDSGRVLEAVDSTQTTGRAFLMDDWQPLGPLTLPLTLAEPSPSGPQAVTRWNALRTGLRHAESLFPRVLPLPPEVSHVADVRIVHGPVPGAAQFMLPGALLAVVPRAVRNLWVGFDTGASSMYVSSRLAASLSPLRVSRETTTGAMGDGVSPVYWFDELGFGQQDFVHLPGTALSMPHINELPSEHPFELVLGGRRLMERSPVLDLDAGRLLLRAVASDAGSGAARAVARSVAPDAASSAARTVRPLSQISGRPTIELPFTDDGGGRPLIEVRIGGQPITVLLDTGFAHPLRLARSDLRRLGLPDDDASWRARGALPCPVSGVHGHAGEELLVQLDGDLVLGPVRLERPWMLITDAVIGTPGSGSDPVSLIGGGALLPFAQVGFDWPGRRLELVLREGVASGGEPAAVSDGSDGFTVPAAGAFLGLILDPPDRGTLSRPHDLPRVTHVVPGSLAERAGLRLDDRLAAIDGVSCTGSAPMDLWPKLRLGGGRQQLVLSIHRGGEERDVLLALP